MSNSWKCVIVNKNGVITGCDRKAANAEIPDGITKIVLEHFMDNYRTNFRANFRDPFIDFFKGVGTIKIPKSLIKKLSKNRRRRKR